MAYTDAAREIIADNPHLSPVETEVIFEHYMYSHEMLSSPLLAYESADWLRGFRMPTHATILPIIISTAMALMQL